MSSYKKLCTEFYDIDKPYAEKDEVDFYLNFIKQNGSYLEAMVGSGRLYIPLREKGLNLHGIDTSDEMLESLKTRCAAKGIEPLVQRQDLSQLKMPLAFDCIFIPLGSFQLITDRSLALESLKAMHRHLTPSGFLLLDTFIPWEAVRGESEKSKRSVQFDEVTQIEIESNCEPHPLEQFFICKNTYRKTRIGQLLEEELELLPITWYFPFEMELFLEKTGFSRILRHEATYQSNAGGIVYQAFR